MTPPPFDPTAERVRDKLVPADAEQFGFKTVYENYDAVLSRYAAHVMTLEDRVAHAVDLHTAVGKTVAAKRTSDPEFSLSSDGVHPNASGHLVIAAAVLGEDEPLAFQGRWAKVFSLTKRRQSILHDAYLAEVGHQRPHVKPGLPVAEAERKATELLREIEAAD